MAADNMRGDRVGNGLMFAACGIALMLVLGAYGFASYPAQALQLPTTIRVSICGNGQVEDEVCDDGTANNTGAYGSSTAARVCLPSCQGFGPYCGDGTLQVRFTEQCDDGNNTSGDLCSATCIEETPATPRATGAPPRGPVEPLPAIPGTISGDILTRVVLRGKAYPNSVVNILLDGKEFGSVTADVNADFLFSTSQVTPGTATFSFNARDKYGTASLTTTAVFEVVRSAVTTVANIFLAPTITAKPDRVASGGLVVLSGQSVPNARISSQIDVTSLLRADANSSGDWALQLDTKSFKDGAHSAKSSFTISDTVKSGYGKAISFFIGNVPASGCGTPDMNEDEKVNLVDFSIFLLSWNTTDPAADFSCDSRVNLSDFSIMLFSWTG